MTEMLKRSVMVFGLACAAAGGRLCPAGQQMEELTAGSPVPRTAAFALAKPGAVKPAGWLRDWAETMAKGYTARMDEVDAEFVRAWKPDFQPRGKKLHWSQGTWSCEGGAYWFDGLVKLGFQLDDEALKQQAKRRLDPILDNMTDYPIGFCWWLDRRDPAHFQEVYDSSDWMVNWVAGILTRPLVAWYQATGDARAKRALESALGDAYWNTCFKNESVDCVAGSVISIPSGARLAAQATGSPKIAAALRAYAEDYAKNPARETYGPAPTNGLEKTLALKRAEMFAQKIPLRHGVVANETLHSLFASAVVTGDEGLWNSWRKWMDFLDTRARMPVGAWVMDEEWGHPGPRRGVETCALAAEVWGRLDFLATLGLGHFGDDIERAFFNAAPACVTRDCRAHVYFQQPNRLKGGDCERLSVRQDGAQQTVFQEKHFPLCCTAGLNRLVPDFIQGLWMTTSDGGVAATLYAPCTFETPLAGGTFAVSEETDYPFGETITLTVKSAPSAAFPLALRLPGWCRDAALAVNGEKVALNPTAGFAKVRRSWRAGDTVTLRLPMKPLAEVVRDLDETQQDYTCVSVGPLLFARGFAEKTANDPAEPAVLPTVDPKTVVEKAEIVRLPLARPFDWPLAAPVRLRTQDAAGQPLELVPYGCTKLRAAMFPQP